MPDKRPHIAEFHVLDHSAAHFVEQLLGVVRQSINNATLATMQSDLPGPQDSLAGSDTVQQVSKAATSGDGPQVDFYSN